MLLEYYMCTFKYRCTMFTCTNQLILVHRVPKSSRLITKHEMQAICATYTCSLFTFQGIIFLTLHIQEVMKTYSNILIPSIASLIPRDMRRFKYETYGQISLVKIVRKVVLGI